MYKNYVFSNVIANIGLMNKSGMYKGLLEPLLLKLLHEYGRMYGYEITQKAKAISKGELNITEGALYPLLHKLEAQGMIEAETENWGNRVRKYYTLTKSGKKETKKIGEELNTFMQTMSFFINPKLTPHVNQ